MMRRIPMMVLLATAALFGCAGDPRTPLSESAGAADGFNLVLVTLDTTRADRLGSYGHAAARMSRASSESSPRISAS